MTDDRLNIDEIYSSDFRREWSESELRTLINEVISERVDRD